VKSQIEAAAGVGVYLPEETKILDSKPKLLLV